MSKTEKQAPENRFKARLLSGEAQIGLWVGLGDSSSAELCARAGFDWLVIDAEHGPNGLRDVLGQLRAIGDLTHPVVRPRDDNRAAIKQMLDIGAQTLLIPMVDSAAQAREIVRSAMYPPQGVRGAAVSLTRASAYGARSEYLKTANREICVLVQAESRAAIEALDEIAAVEGVDGVFIGPSDLSTDMGYPGEPDADEVQETIRNAVSRIRSAGKAVGILGANRPAAKRYAALGVDFLAVGSDVGVLSGGLKALRADF